MLQSEYQGIYEIVICYNWEGFSDALGLPFMGSFTLSRTGEHTPVGLQGQEHPRVTALRWFKTSACG